MAQFQAYSPTVEVKGEAVLAVVDGLSTIKLIARDILNECGIENPQPGQWYSQQAWLDAFKIIAEKLGPTPLKNIGRKIPANAHWPEHVQSIEVALEMIDQAYHMNHRNGEIGHYRYISEGPRRALMICDGPYPDYFDLGIIEAVAEKFVEPGSKVAVRIDQSKPTRVKGADSTTYIVAW